MKNRSILPTALLLATALALPAGAAQGTVTNKDHKFVMEAATGGLEEVRLGQLATERAIAESDHLPPMAGAQMTRRTGAPVSGCLVSGVSAIL